MAKRTPSGTPALLILQRAGVTHVVHAYEHDPTVASVGLEAAHELGVSPDRVFKTLVADVDGASTVAIVPVSGTLDLKKLAAACGAKRARMLEPAVAERLTGYVVGGISPFGQRTPSRTIVDSSATDFPTVYVSAGRRGLDVEVDPHDLIRLTSAHTAQIGAP